MARLATDRYQYPRARQLFTAVAEQFPRTAAAETAAYEAAQLEYDTQDYEAAAVKMIAVAQHAPKTELAKRALWVSGWSAYLSKTSSLAITAFTNLLELDIDPELRDAAAYWLARTRERKVELNPAIEGYRRLASESPFRYYGLLARTRLEKLGAPLLIAPPPESASPATPEELARRLGPERPVTVDRAIALFRANLRSEAIEELLAAAAVYRGTRDAVGLASMIDAFQMFEREKWASVLARNIADDDGVQPGDSPELWRLWRTAYPVPFLAEVERASKDHQVDPFLTYSVMRTESRFRPDAVSPVGARGLMQLMPRTARWIAHVVSRARSEAAHYRAPGPNIYLGAWYVKNLVDRFHGNLAQALGAYNAGPEAMERWVKKFDGLEWDEFAERTPYLETRRYIRRTLESYLVYHQLYDPPGVAFRAGS
jgi:soluble lytic murein transglycosylase